MAFALQPSLRPPPPWFVRACALAALIVAVLALGLVSHARRMPPRLLLSGPHHDLEYPRAVEREIASAKTRVWMSMFVVHPDQDGPVMALLGALAAAAERGVHVQVCLDLGTVYGTGETDTKHEAPLAWLRAHGVRALLDERERTSHAKVLIIDGERVVIGSHNWTRDALTRNREASVVLEDRGLAAELSELLAAIPGWERDY
jgi:phosphatidylserine/phosphatidylglycerophosphate/cardiolipin synthase-like enzyme